jgi:protoporphyrinogen oxidase
MINAIIIGGGPSGLAAAYEVTCHGAKALVLEKLEQVGGLSRTIPYDGCLFDIGPHRFFTKNQEVHQLFVDVVAEDLLRVPRQTRIFFRDHFFDYPLSPMNALLGIGPMDAARVIASYGAQRLRRLRSSRESENFQEWVTDQFGARLFELFFKTYTEKVWGIPCTVLSADWAGQRIKGLNLTQAISNAVLRNKGREVKSLVNEFVFPRLGAGQFYQKMKGKISAQGGQVETGLKVIRLVRENSRIRSVVARDETGRRKTYEAEYFLSSAPLTETVESIFPSAPPDVLQACHSLRYRSHIGVHIKYQGLPFPDDWLYIHSKDLKMARIANYRNFSRAMADDDGVSPLTVEYFASPGDELSRFSDEGLIHLAAVELTATGLIDPRKIISAFVVRSEKAYPLLECLAEPKVKLIEAWVNMMENLIPIGRCGMFKYNNQDHAIFTGLLAARRALEVGDYNPWQVNIDAEYHEAGSTR